MIPTPALDRLFGPTALAEFEAQCSLASVPAAPSKPVVGIYASRACPSCGGTGKPRRRRRASTSESATAARQRRRHARAAARRACRACDGSGYVSLDARPGPPVLDGTGYEMPDPPACEFADRDARRVLPALAAIVGLRWVNQRHEAPADHPYAPLYPLTFAGQLLNETRQLAYAAQAAEEARDLLTWAEKCAAAALASVRISGVPKGRGLVN